LDVEMGRDGFLWLTTPTTIYRLVAAATTTSGGVVFTIAGLSGIAIPSGETADARQASAAPVASYAPVLSRKP